MIWFVIFTYLQQFIFVYHLKNPTAVQDDFWILFLNLWIFGFLLTSQITMHTLPGKDQIRISACIGKMPQKYSNVPFKNNYALFFVVFLSVLFHMGYFIFKMYLKHFQSAKLKEFEEFKKLNKNINMYNNASNVSAMFLLVVGTFSAFKLTTMNPEEIDTYPNYILLYLQDLFIYTTGTLFFLIIYLNKNEIVRKYVFRNINDVLLCQQCP